MRVPTGRRDILSIKSRKQLLAGMTAADLAQNSVSTKEFPKLVMHQMGLERAERGLTPDAIKEPCEKTLSDLRKELGIERVERPSTQNERRHDVIFNF